MAKKKVVEMEREKNGNTLCVAETCRLRSLVSLHLESRIISEEHRWVWMGSVPAMSVCQNGNVEMMHCYSWGLVAVTPAGFALFKELPRGRC